MHTSTSKVIADKKEIKHTIAAYIDNATSKQQHPRININKHKRDRKATKMYRPTAKP